MIVDDYQRDPPHHLFVQYSEGIDVGVYRPPPNPFDHQEVKFKGHLGVTTAHNVNYLKNLCPLSQSIPCP